MLAFNYHITLSFALAALALGAAILIWAKIHENLGTSFAKLIAYVIIILSVANILCTGYYGWKYWSEGYMDKPYPAMARMQMPQGGMMMPCPMMQQMMKGNMQSQMKQQPMMPKPVQMMGNQTIPNLMILKPGQMMSNQTMPNQMIQNQPISNQSMQMDMKKIQY